VEAYLQWYDGVTPPRTMWEELINLIWDGYDLAGKVAGFEYWCNVKTPRKTPTGWHADADAIKQLRNQLAMPELGAIFYGYPHNITGGELEIAPRTHDATATCEC